MLVSALIFRAAAERFRHHPRLSLRAEIHKLTHLRGARGRPVVAPLHLRFGALSADNYPAIDVSPRGGSSAPKTAMKTRDDESPAGGRESEGGRKKGRKTEEGEETGVYGKLQVIAGHLFARAYSVLRERSTSANSRRKRPQEAARRGIRALSVLPLKLHVCWREIVEITTRRSVPRQCAHLGRYGTHRRARERRIFTYTYIELPARHFGSDIRVDARVCAIFRASVSQISSAFRLIHCVSLRLENTPLFCSPEGTFLRPCSSPLPPLQHRTLSKSALHTPTKLHGTSLSRALKLRKFRSASAALSFTADKPTWSPCTSDRRITRD